MRDDQKNLFLAMGLSLLVIIGWQYFYAGPKQERAREVIAQTQSAVPGAPAETAQTPGLAPAPSSAPAAATPDIALTREAALATSPRIKIDTPALKGSIALKGGRIDDVSLKGFRETVDPNSPNITLLSPANAPHPFYADTGFVGQSGSGVSLPKADTLWTADADALTTGKPVTLTYDNGQGLVFTRKIAVDDQFMFTVTDGVRNASSSEVSLFPYAIVARRGKPQTSGYAVLHEGFIGIVGNFGVAILIVTVLVKGLFFPLANRSYLSMAKMKAVQPQMEAIKARYPEDKQKQQQEFMELYKREGINPVAGCLPIAVQIPVFFALYKVIFITIEMRQAPFFGWIRDLSAPDPTNIFNLFGVLPFDPSQVPFIGHFLVLGVWPLIMGVSMFIQMKMNPEPADPVQKQMFAWMPVIFTFMLGAFPAGLVIYWTWNNTLSVTQQYLIMRKAGVKVELWDNLRKLVRKPAKS